MSPASENGEWREPETRPRRRARFSTTGYLTPALVVLVSAGLLVAAFERGRGHYHRLRSRVASEEAGGPPPSLGPGGQAALTLRRTASSTSQPEFVSVTLLPGRGMNVLQITASVPGHGEVPLLFSPDLATISQVLTASGPDAYGAMSSTFGGAVAVPWSGQLTGLATANRSVLQGVWQGERLTFPAAADNSNLSTEGLLLNRGADAVETSSVPGGKAVQAVFHAGTFGGNWPASSEVTVETEITGHDFELSVGVKNTGEAPMPMGIGWHPYFALPGEQRRAALLSIPASQRLAHDERSSLASGAAIPVAGTAFDFNSARGVPLGAAGLNTTYLHLQHGILSDGPVAELRNPVGGYALRLTPLTESIRFLHVVAPTGQPWISIVPATNLDDALRHESGRSASRQAAQPDASLDTLQPGDTLRWRCRLEIVPLN